MTRPTSRRASPGPDLRETDPVLPDPASRAAEPAQARPDPEVELHPERRPRGIADGNWVSIETPDGGMRARARLNDRLDPRVVVGEHGWWQACAALGAPGYDPFSADGANFNRTVDATLRDPVSGTPAHRANLCEVRPSAPVPAFPASGPVRRRPPAPASICLAEPSVPRGVELDAAPGGTGAD